MTRLTLSQKAWIIAGLMAAVLIGVHFLFILIGYSTTSSSECKTCHLASYQSWKENKIHRKSITCTFCHSRRMSSQFAYQTERLSTMPKELDRECLKCHRNYMEDKKVKVTVLAETVDEKDGKVLRVFGPWRLKEITCRTKFSCIHCHKNIAHDRGFPPTNLPRIDYCVECHYHQNKEPYSELFPRPRLVFIKNGKRMVSPGLR